MKNAIHRIKEHEVLMPYMYMLLVSLLYSYANVFVRKPEPPSYDYISAGSNLVLSHVLSLA